MTKTIEAALTRDAALADPTTRFRRISGAIALPLAFAFQLAANASYAVISTESGLTDTGPAEETLELYSRYAGPMTAVSVLAMIGALLAIPGVLAALRVLRPYRPRLALWATVLMITGYVCYFGIAATNFSTVALAAQDVPGDVFAAATAVPIAAMPFFLAFVVGNLIGTTLLGLAVLLSRGLPRWAGWLIIGWPVGHVINVFFGGGEWFAVGGGALEIAGLAVLTGVALRTDDAQWRERG